MRKPQKNTLFGWFEAAIEDMADSVEQLNQDLGEREEEPKWERKVFNDSWDIVSLRRWSFILPGGGAVRGGRPPKPIPPVTRGGPGTLASTPGKANQPAAAVRSENVPVAPPMVPPRPVMPSVPVVEPAPPKGGLFGRRG